MDRCTWLGRDRVLTAVTYEFSLRDLLPSAERRGERGLVCKGVVKTHARTISSGTKQRMP